MNPVRLLAKLTTRGVRIEGCPGGQIELTSQDVAAALGMGSLNEQAYLIGRAKFSDDGFAQGVLVDRVEQAFRARCQAAGWKQDYCRGIAELCVFELVWNGACPHCAGRGAGWVKPRDSAVQLWRDCGVCKGTGRKRLTIRERASIAGVGKSQFAAEWQQRADKVMLDLWSMESDCLRHLVRQFTDLVA